MYIIDVFLIFKIHLFIILEKTSRVYCDSTMILSFYEMYYGIFMVLSFYGVKVSEFEDITRALGYLNDQISTIHKTKTPNISGIKINQPEQSTFFVFSSIKTKRTLISL